MLTATERTRATLYKWRYTLEHWGFSREESRGLMFLRWLVQVRGGYER